MTMLPVNYNDPLYAHLAQLAEAKFGLPSGLLDAIRTLGERSNANQVSEAGARTPYQFIPATRRGIQRNYGIDPLSSAEAATEGAAHLLAENLRRAGNVPDAVAMYHGGLNRRNWGPRTRAYVDRVSGGLMGQSRYPYDAYYSNGPDPLAPLPDVAPERPTQPTPIPGDPGPSTSLPAASPMTSHKRGGILGALASVFMPDPGSLWAAALRGGVFNARENQADYRAQQAKQALDLQMTQAKLKQFLTKGEYQIAGNNLIHIPADGGQPEIITPPATPSEHERLLQAWRTETNPEAKEMMRRMLLGANAPDVIQTKQQGAERVARIRAGATTTSARIRSNATSKTLPPLPPGFTVVK